MNKPRLCLALSVSLALLQASVLPVLSEPASPAIWQKLAGVSKPVAKSAAKKTSVASCQTKRPVATKPVGGDALGLYTAYGLASGLADSQVMLFFGKGKDAASQMPAAALTIHPTLPVVAEQHVAAAPAEKPTLLAMGEPVGGTQITADAGSTISVPQTEPAPMADAPKPAQPEMAATEIVAAKPEANDKLQIAQLAPDQIIAQGDNSGTLSTPIPPVVSGAVELEEFKPSNMIELKVNQSRTFKLRNKIVRTSISEPSIAEPVVVAENQMVLLGKAPGGATMVVWDDAGNSAAIDIKVSRDFSALQSTIREIDPRIIVKPFTVGGGDRVLLVGDVDHPESVLRAMSAANVFMDDRGMSILAANSRLINARIGEMGQQGGGGGAAGGGGGGGGGGASGQLSQISQVDKYTFFSNLNNNIGKAQVIVSEAARVTSLIRVRKTPLIVLHVTFMEMNSTAVRELGLQLGLNFTNNSFAFGVGGGGTSNVTHLSTLPGINGSNPGGYGFNQNATPTALNTTFTTPQGIAFPLGFGNPVSTTPFGTLPAALAPSMLTPTIAGPWLSQMLGFLQQLPQKLPGFGAITSPVRFLNGAVINPDGTMTNTLTTSPVGQGVMNVSPVALLQGSSLFGSAPGAGSFTPDGSLANLFTSMSNFTSGNLGRWSINPTVQGIITQRRARVLAEPTLVTISGERASFLAGGEIPILQSIATAGTAQQSISFEPFGLRLNIIPVLLETGAVNLQVSPEERLLDQANGLFLLGAGTSRIPAFIVRKTQTIVEMKPGQELYISGLVSANSSRELNKTPVLGEIPVLGALYRSKAFNKNESELVVAVRPEIIIPGTPGQLKLPEEISRVEGPRDTNIFQVEPTVIDERYATSGRAERPQRVPGIQPGSAPVPDNF